MTDTITLKQAVGIVLEGFTLPDAARKILETAYFAEAALAQQAEQVPEPRAYLVYAKGSRRYYTLTFDVNKVAEIYIGGEVVPLYERDALQVRVDDQEFEILGFGKRLVAQQVEQGWQPIETAPKETEIFIGRFIDGKFKFGRSEMFYEKANEFAGETFSGWVWSEDECSSSITDSPTHWMPLPNPPKDIT